jgi:hypothetical protein
MTWAQLLKRVFKIDMETCNVCGEKMAVISAITDPEVIQKIPTELFDQMAMSALPINIIEWTRLSRNKVSSS